MNLLPELLALKRELKNRTYRLSKQNEFVLSERGKTRLIKGDHIRDRVVKRALCDEILLPAVRPYLIHDNGAGLEGKGIAFARKRLELHVKQFYRQTRSNAGYIYLADYTKYFDNIDHKRILGIFRKFVKDDLALWLIEQILEQARPDISFLGESEIGELDNNPFSSLRHQKTDQSLLTGERFLARGMSIGDQVAQVAGLVYPYRLDNYIKIVEGVKWYGRYMDDSYIIHADKEYLKELSARIEERALKEGIFINRSKTRICKLSGYWRFLKVQYSLTATGRVIKKIHPENLTRMRRRFKKLAPVMTKDEFEQFYRAWFKNHYKIMSKKQRQNLDGLVQKLKEEHYD